MPRHTPPCAGRLLLASVPVLALLAGCGIVPLSTQLAMRNFDPLAFDPATPRVAIVAPDYLHIRGDGAKLRLSSWRVASPDKREEHVFALQEVAGTPPPALSETLAAGERLAVYRLSAGDIERARRLQAEHRARKLAEPNGQVGEIKADVTACRTASLPPRGIKGSVYIMVDPAKGYLPLLQAVDLRDLAKSGGKTLEEEVLPCPPAKRG